VYRNHNKTESFKNDGGNCRIYIFATKYSDTYDLNSGVSYYLAFPINDCMNARATYQKKCRLSRSKLSFLIEKKSKMRYRCTWKRL